MGYEPYDDISSVMDDAHAFIDTALGHRSNSKILVLCNTGIDRAGALVIGYMMRKQHVSTASSSSSTRRQHGQDFMAQARKRLAKVRRPLLQQQSFRPQLALWADDGFDAAQARRHPLWEPTVFRCFALKVCQKISHNAPPEQANGT